METSYRPVIGIASWRPTDAERLAEAIERNGGEPWPIPPDQHGPTEDKLARVAGLLVGGEPTAPLWSEEESQGNAAPTTEDGHWPWERQLLRAALDDDMPVLCTCAGMQVLNLVMGGRITQAPREHGPIEQDGEVVSSYHRIYISPGSKLAATVGSGGFVRVNSRHYWGAREPQKSPVLLASAYSLEDGVIEALESPDHRWVVGVQFQPERPDKIPPHFQRLFQSLVEHAREYTNSSEQA